MGKFSISPEMNLSPMVEASQERKNMNFLLTSKLATLSLCSPTINASIGRPRKKNDGCSDINSHQNGNSMDSPNLYVRIKEK